MKVPAMVVLLGAAIGSAPAQQGGPAQQGSPAQQGETAAVGSREWIADILESSMATSLEKAQQARWQSGSQAAAGQGSLKIVSLADWHAPASVRDAAAARAVAAPGTVQVAAGSLPSIAEAQADFRGSVLENEQLTRRLGYVPADVSGTVLGELTLLATLPAGTISGDRASGLERVWEIPETGLIMFAENDYVASGRQITLFRESLNAEVQGMPARRLSTRSADGRGSVQLSWYGPRKSYKLTLITDDAVRLEEGERLLGQVAEGIVDRR